MTWSVNGEVRELARDERGQVLVLVLIVLAVGTLMVTSFLTAESADLLSARESSAHLGNRTAADAGVEHGIWRVRYDPTFVAGLPVSTPVSYQKTVDGMPVTISVTLVPTPTPLPTPTPQPGHNFQVGKTVEPPYAPPGQTTVFTYTIQVINTGTATIKLEQMWDVLPQGFTYVPGSSSGFTTAEPTLSMQNGQQTVDWEFNSPKPSIASGQTGTQVFRATATPQDGTYYNQAWVEPTYDSGNPASSGDAAPIAVTLPQYDIRASAGTVAIRSRVGIQSGVVRIRSWREE
ncbi:MAG: hypothetical protein Q7T26_03040 [Dehalococcoidia bacterium]|nr:hypothetical protein [Dehalococcoidia bacterium]